MKIKDIIIGVLTIAVVILGILYYNERYNIDEQRISDQLYKGKCQSANALCDTSKSECGRAYNESAINEIRQSIERRTNIFNQVYGYQIHLVHIDEMYKSIQKFNALARENQTDSIMGIRIYEASSERKINGKIQREPDLVIIPYLENCHDIFSVDPEKFHESGIKIYTHFRPCPKLCADQGKYYIYQR